MTRLLIDEDLPRSLAPALRDAGYDATDVRDCGLRGAPDARVYEYAQEHGYALVTGDLEFANELLYPASAHHGVVLSRFPTQLPVGALVAHLVQSVKSLCDENLNHTIVIIEPGRLRLRRMGGR